MPSTLKTNASLIPDRPGVIPHPHLLTGHMSVLTSLDFFFFNYYWSKLVDAKTCLGLQEIKHQSLTANLLAKNKEIESDCRNTYNSSPFHSECLKNYF